MFLLNMHARCSKTDLYARSIWMHNPVPVQTWPNQTMRGIGGWEFES